MVDRRKDGAFTPPDLERLQLFDIALDAIIGMDSAGKVTAWNRSAEQIFGYSKVEVLGQKLADLIIPPNLRRQHGRGLENYLRTGKGPLINRRIEVSAVHRDGHQFPAELAIVAVQKRGKNVFYGFVRDLTERTKIQETQRLRQETEQQFRLLIDGVKDYAISMLDHDGCIKNWNSGAERIEGYAADEVIGKHYSLFFTEQARQAGAPEQALETAKREGRFEAEDWRVRKDGSSFLADVVIEAIRDEAGELVGFARVIRDITERQQAREAEHASEAKTQFVASMSHEIRTPLNGIIGYTERLMDEALTPDQRRYAERIQTAGSALLTIIDDILHLSQIEAGVIEFDEHPFSLEALIDNTVSIISGAAEAKGLSVRLALDPDLPKVLVGDEARLRQVLLNLLNNAIKFTHKGQITVEIRSDKRVGEGELLRFSVADTGIGIPAGKRDRLFRRFSQVDPTTRREFGGTGLGLAISKRLVELMGGEIGFESEQGRGSTFWFQVTLPEARAEDIASAEESVPQPTESARVLLAEDLEINQELARSILEKAGHQVDVVANGAEAVAALKVGSYDLVLMDIQMPIMDGLSATKEIRALDPPARDVPIIAMTANVLPQQIRNFRQAGMDDHIGKPMKRADLLTKVGDWLPASNPSVEATSIGPEDSTRPVFDQHALESLRDLVGPERASDWLERLKEQLDCTFADQALTLLDRDQLRRSAHAIVSQAGTLGFFELSDACRHLEEACTSGTEIFVLFEKAQAAARAARETISKLLERSTS